MITKKSAQVLVLMTIFSGVFSGQIFAETYQVPTLNKLAPNPENSSAPPAEVVVETDDHLRYKINQQLDAPRDVASENGPSATTGRTPNSEKKSEQVITPAPLEFKQKSPKSKSKKRNPSSSEPATEKPEFWKF